MPPSAAPTTAIVPAPLDALAIPAALDGRDGANRAAGREAQIVATHDLDALRAWLARFTDTKTTFESYRKETERLLLRTIVKHPRTDGPWRPFYGPLSPASQRQAMVILNVMFAWLVQAGYLAGNPLSLSRQRARKAPPRITRYLEPELWQEVKAYIGSMPRETARERFHYSRVRWLFTLLYLGGSRITEVGANTMGQFFSRRDAAGRERWWLEVTGKGNRERLVPATAEMMAELTRYRHAHDLSALPLSGEDTPLVLPVGIARKQLTRAALHRIVKEVFAGAANSLRASNQSNEERANRLEQASAHWLRHSPGSHMADQQVDLRLVRDNLGHASLTTTSTCTSTTIVVIVKLRKSIGSNGEAVARQSGLASDRTLGATLAIGLFAVPATLSLRRSRSAKNPLGSR
jgi:site-specific recombinase XerD